MWKMALALFAVGCGSWLHKEHMTYDSPKGDVPVVIENHHEGALCELSIRNADHTYDSTDPYSSKYPHYVSLTIIGEHDEAPPRLEPGKAIQVGIKPGTYELYATSCDKEWLGAWKPVNVKDPVAVGVDGPETSAPASYQHLAFKMFEDPHCAVQGTPTNNPADCCEGRWTKYKKPNHPDDPPHCSYDDEDADVTR